MFVVVVFFCSNYYHSLLSSGFFKEIFVEVCELPIEDGSFVNHGYGYGFEGVFCLTTYYYAYYKHISEGL